jgi:hypothetical protein
VYLFLQKTPILLKGPNLLAGAGLQGIKLLKRGVGKNKLGGLFKIA